MDSVQRNKSLLILIQNIPEMFKGRWLTIHETVTILFACGAKEINKNDISLALRVNRNSLHIEKMKFNNTMFISIGVPKKNHPRHRVVPKINARRKVFQENPKCTNALAALGHESIVPKTSMSQLHLRLSRLCPAVPVNTTEDTDTNRDNDDRRNGIIHTGYKICSIDEDRKWTSTVMEHARKCLNGQLLVIATIHSGFELFETYKCTQCNTELMKRGSFNIETNKKVTRLQISI